MSNRDLDRFGGMGQEFRKWYLEQTYSGKRATGKRKHTEKRKRMNEESTLKMVTEKKRSFSRRGRGEEVYMWSEEFCCCLGKSRNKYIIEHTSTVTCHRAQV